MSELEKILNADQQPVFLNRTGYASCARIAAEALASGRSTVLVALKEHDLHELAALCRLFIPSLSVEDYPDSQPAWQRSLVTFPAIRHFEDQGVWSSVLANLYALSLKGAHCVVVSSQSLLLKYVPKNFFSGKCLDLAINADFSPELIIDQTVEWGYERVQMVSTQGEMALRGDILDIFPPGYSKPVRIEFFGDIIEEMRVFDVESQRSIANIRELTLIPASPLPLDAKGVKSAINRFVVLEKEGRLTDNEAYSLKKKMEEDGQGVLPGLAWENSSFFEDWLPENSIWILPGENDSVDTLFGERQKIKEQLESDKAIVQQPAAIALRRKTQPAPWNGKKCIYAEPLRMGIEEKGLNFPERDYNSFSELFPLVEDKDRPWQTLVRSIKQWQREQKQIIFAFHNDRSRRKFLKLAEMDGILPHTRYHLEQHGIYALISSYAEGAWLEWAKIYVLGENIIFPKSEKQVRKATKVFKGLDNFENLKAGDLIVHRDYGIGRYAGLHHLDLNSAANDFLLLEYSGNDKLYVPVDRLGLIQRFKGQEGSIPVLDKLGSQAWNAGKERARKAIEHIAQDLVEMYAYRKVAKSFHYDPPGELYHEFEATFNFEETPDQARTIQEVLNDMDNNLPMDRLVCGDVGFGKTEVALRAAFRAAAEGRQVALLCPTTVLAEQHYQTFRSRLAGFPINVGLLSRFVPRAKQKETLEACAKGQIDILIGTHRLLSNDVNLPNLGLLVLDEEQRFGVRHKEKLKSLKKNVDVLTLTATPIPRTLQLSMSGIRDLSVIETAPVDRKPVASAIVQRDDETLRNVINRELERKGQVFWVYNRVQDIERVREYVQKLVPNARVALAHGQMAEKDLETTMRKFWHGEIDVLVCTSIVESGLDFPDANTLIVDQAQMFGLGQLYQLRGRVGRSDKQAYAYFVVPDPRRLTDIASERLRIILDMDFLGAGFQVAMEDLRLRGAGNILGEAQSGHISRVGLDLYLEMLEEAVKKIKGEAVNMDTEPELNLGISAHIPETYINDSRERLRYYKALSSTHDASERMETVLAIKDRYGQFPAEFNNFLAMLEFKDFLGKLQVEKADITASSLKLVWSQEQTALDPSNIVNLVTKNPAVKMQPPATLLLPLTLKDNLSESLEEVKTILKPLIKEKKQEAHNASA